jgi:putative selenate reductase
MKALGARSISEFIQLSARDHGDSEIRDTQAAIIHNTAALLERSVRDPRYHAQNNRRAPRKIGSHLHLWDCINCDKCIPACPNDANFFFEVEPVEIHYNNIKIVEDGWTEIEGGVFTISEEHQIATFADACNDCGNCDVFCPEDGGPYIEKPRFFGSVDTWRRWNTLGGFVLVPEEDMVALYGRLNGKEYVLDFEEHSQKAVFKADGALVTIDWGSCRVLTVDRRDASVGHVIDMGPCFTMVALMKGVLNPNRVHFVNVCMTNLQRKAAHA